MPSEFSLRLLEESCGARTHTPPGDPQRVVLHSRRWSRAHRRLSLLRCCGAGDKRGGPLAGPGPASNPLAAPPTALARPLPPRPLLPQPLGRPPAGRAYAPPSPLALICQAGSDTSPSHRSARLTPPQPRTPASQRALHPPAPPRHPAPAAPPHGAPSRRRFSSLLCTKWLGGSALDSQCGFLLTRTFQKPPSGALVAGQGRGDVENKRRTRWDSGGLIGWYHCLKIS